MSLAHLGKAEPFQGGCTFSKGFLPGEECNFIISLKANVWEEGQEGQMRSTGQGLRPFPTVIFVRFLRIKNPVADDLAL